MTGTKLAFAAHAVGLVIFAIEGRSTVNLARLAATVRYPDRLQILVAYEPESGPLSEFMARSNAFGLIDYTEPRGYEFTPKTGFVVGPGHKGVARFQSFTNYEGRFR